VSTTKIHNNQSNPKLHQKQPQQQ